MPMPLGIRKYHNYDYAAFGRRFFIAVIILLCYNKEAVFSK